MFSVLIASFAQAMLVQSLAAAQTTVVPASIELSRIYVRADMEIELTIARAMERFAAEHQSEFPSTVEQLVPSYLPFEPIVPGSNHTGRYRITLMDPNNPIGRYVITDDSSLDLTGSGLVSTADRAKCVPKRCQELMYSPVRGFVGGSEIIGE
jgi:hypothetical protein